MGRSGGGKWRGRQRVNDFGSNPNKKAWVSQGPPESIQLLWIPKVN